jgi:hypothetical protein
MSFTKVSGQLPRHAEVRRGGFDRDVAAVGRDGYRVVIGSGIGRLARGGGADQLQRTGLAILARDLPVRPERGVDGQEGDITSVARHGRRFATNDGALGRRGNDLDDAEVEVDGDGAIAVVAVAGDPVVRGAGEHHGATAGGYVDRAGIAVRFETGARHEACVNEIGARRRGRDGDRRQRQGASEETAGGCEIHHEAP